MGWGVREEEERGGRGGKKKISRASASTEGYLSADVAGATKHSASKDFNHRMQKTRKHVCYFCSTASQQSRQEKEEKEDKNMQKKMSVENVLTERE